MKLLVADKFDSHALEELRHLGLELLYEPELSRETLPSRLSQVGILIVRSTEVSQEAIESGRQLHLIVRAGAGTTGIDVQAASMRGIYVSHCPGKNAVAVAELVMGFLTSLDRRLPEAIAQMRLGQWERAEYSKALGLFGQTLGLLGVGAVAKEVAQRARAFGMNVVGWSRSLSLARANELGIGHTKSPEELASRVQILSVHLPLTDRTRGIVGSAVLDALPERAILINTAAADLVDTAALSDAVERRGLRVALDVFGNEPEGTRGLFHHPLLGHAQVYCTPHIGAGTDQSELAITQETIRIVRSFVRTGEVPSCVNVCATSPARYQMVIRSLDKVGVLANVLGVVKRHGLNVEELSSTIFDGAVAACTKLRISGRPSDACVAEIKAFEEVFHVDIVALPNLA